MNVRLKLKCAGFGALLGAVVYFLWCNVGRWNDFVEQHEARVARLSADPGERTPLLGPPIKGNALEAYEAAYYARRGDPDELALLDGARRTRIVPEPTTAQYTPGSDRGWILDYAGWHLRRAAPRHLREGNLNGAIDFAAGTLQVAADLQREQAMYYAGSGLGLGTESEAVLAAIIVDPQTTAPLLDRIESLLDAYEAQMNISRAIEGERAGADAALLDVHEGRRTIEASSLTYVAMRNATTTRLLLLSHADQIARWCAGVREAMALRWPAAAEIHARVRKEAYRLDDPISRTYSLVYPDRLDQEWRWAVGYHRMLKAALMCQRGRGPEDSAWPSDPFSGDPLKLEEAASGRRISVPGVSLVAPIDGRAPILGPLTIEVPK